MNERKKKELGLRSATETMEQISKLDQDVQDLIFKYVRLPQSEGPQLYNEVGQLVTQLDLNTVSTDLKTVEANYNKVYTWAAGLPVDEVQRRATEYYINNKLTTLLDTYPAEAYKKMYNTKITLNTLMASGEMTLDQASKVMAKNFKLDFVTYSDGKKYDATAYSKMLLRTEQGQYARNISEQHAKTLGTNTYRVSSHANPREACSYIQGKLINYDNLSNVIIGGKRYQCTPANSVQTGASGYKGVNCGHIETPVSQYSSVPDFEVSVDDLTGF